MQRPEAVFRDGRCSTTTVLYLAPTTFGVSTDEVGALVPGAVSVVAGFLAFFFDFLVDEVAVVDVFFISVLASALFAVGAVAAGLAAGAAAVAGAAALAGAAGAVVCAAAVSDTANAPAISALNILVMTVSSG
jgi:hypothetical protein